MERIQKILNHPLYQEQFKLLQDAEKIVSSASYNGTFC